MFQDLFKETIWSLMGNKIRSALTILGIVIGIASVIAMVAIGQGAKKSIENQIESIGSNLIMVMPGANRSGSVSQGRGSAQTLTIQDAEAIQAEVGGLRAVAPQISGSYQIIAKGNNTNTQVIGTVPDYTEVRNIEIDLGDFFNQQQLKTSAKVAVLGSSTRDDLFGEASDPVGQTVRINGVDFRIIGVAKEKGGSGFNSSDDVIYVPMSVAKNYLSGSEYVNIISITAENQTLMSEAQTEISALLLSRHKIENADEADFNIMNQNDIIETASSITNTFTMLLASIAGISLLVGGIGIMNMMLTTVTERTREIGLRKAVGIRKVYINLQFLAEAVVLTFIGGIIGIFLGWVIAIVAAKLASLTVVMSFSSILLAFGVSAAIGIIFGFYPARRAANLSPIEALRYE